MLIKRIFTDLILKKDLKTDLIPDKSGEIYERYLNH